MEQESAVNAALGDVRRRCHYEGAMTETVGRHYRYLAKGSALSEVVPSIRYNILHNNLEVYPKELFSTLASKEYTSVDEPNYRFCMEDVENMPGWVMLRCVDIPAGYRHNKRYDASSIVSSATYDRVLDDSDGYSKYSDYDLKGENDQSGENSASSVGPTIEIAKRPPMKTPEQSSSSSSEEDEKRRRGVDEFYQSGQDFMKGLENKITKAGVDPRFTKAPIPDSDYIRKRREGPYKYAATMYGRAPPSSSSSSGRGSNPRSKASGTSSEDDYDYTSITDLPRLLKRPTPQLYGDGMTSSKKYRSSNVPIECFQSLRTKVVDTEDNPLGIAAQVEWKTYLSSANFFGYFEGTFYEWGQRIDRGQSLDEASAYKSAICCTQLKMTPNCKYRATLEFVPVIPVPKWPEVAQEWVLRRRRPALDKRTNIEYSWPRQSQIETIVRQGCHLVTEGGKFRGRNTPNTKLEWQLSFGAAHEVLLSSLSRQHLNAFLWARLIFRHVLAPTGVLSIQHLETIFFWLVESSYTDWPDAALGERVLAIFHTLYDCIRRRKLPHYFIKKRNLLHTKAQRDIFKAQEKLFRLIESFVPLTIQAAKHLQTSHSIYPFPDLARLWEIVTTKLSFELIINPALGESRKQLNSIMELHGGQKPKRSSKPTDEGFWEMQQKQKQPPAAGGGDKTRDYLRKERARLEAEEREKKGASLPDTAESSLDKAAEVVINPFNITQTKMLLEYFIQHFIAMVRSSNKIRAYSTSTVLVMQAENLAILLKEEGFYDQAEDFMVEIDELKAACSQGIFTEPFVEIPGSPCIFPTGVPPSQSSVKNSAGSSRPNSAGSSKLAVPLPATPEQRRSKANGDVGQQAARTKTSPATEGGNSVVVTTEVVIESSSSRSDDDQSSPVLSKAKSLNGLSTSRIFESETDELEDECTDF